MGHLKVMSRSGSHAGRGFRYQDSIGVWLLAKSWLGELPYGVVIPEGRDDYEASCAEGVVLLQVKSRRKHLGYFPIADTVSFIRALWGRAEVCEKQLGKLILVLEAPVIGGSEFGYRVDEHAGLREAMSRDPGWARLAVLTYVWIVPSPSESAIAAIASTMPCTPLSAQIYYSELLKKIGAVADANGLVENGDFHGLTVSDMEESIRAIEPILDLAGMEEALLKGYCSAIDFLTPINDSVFYQGVDTRPGHLAAGLVIERPEACSLVVSSLESRGAALIKGASGTGKSALMWESASSIRGYVRWFEVKRGDESDVHLFIRLAQALRASLSTPIGFVLDDVGRGLAELWDGLVREVSAENGLFLLGSIREEDVFLLTARARAAEVHPEVDDLVAERIWTKLKEQDRTTWVGWREPWKYSSGFLLEYTHILTRGDRLESVLSEQIDRRVREGRDEELAVLRVASLVGAAGAVLDVSLLAKTLGLSVGNLARALHRLVDEHLIAEPIAGKIKGLHQLRSSVLCELCHDKLFLSASQTIVNALHSVTSESLRVLVVYVALHHADDTLELIKNIAKRVESDCDPAAVISAFSGLGQAHIEVTLRKWLEQAINVDLQPTQATIAVMFAVSEMSMTGLPVLENMQRAVRALRVSSIDDPRLLLISNISACAIESVVEKSSLVQLRSLLGGLVGVSIPEKIQFALKKITPNFDDIGLLGAADLLSAVQLIDRETAVAWTAGDVLQNLLDRVPAEIPWAAPVQISMVAEGRLLSSSIYHVVDSVQKDVHQEVVQLCRVLFGLDPMVEVVAVDAIAADGLLAGLKAMPIATKRIQRSNSPASVLPEWNKRWVEATARLVGIGSYSDYLQQSKLLLAKLVPVLERVIDSILRSKVPPARVLERLGEVHEASRILTSPRESSSENEEAEHFGTSTQYVLFNCSSELIRKFIDLPERYAAFVLWTGDLIKKIDEMKSEPWELIGKAPEVLLSQLRVGVESLRLLAAEAGVRDSKPAHQWQVIAKRASIGNALKSISFSADEMLKRRFSAYVNQVKNDLKNINSIEEIYTRSTWAYPLPWPPLELMLAVRVGSLFDWYVWLQDHGSLLRSVIGDGRKVLVLPCMDGVLVPRFAVGGVSTLFPSPDLAGNWLESLGLRCLDDCLSRQAERIISFIVELDGLRVFSLGVAGRPSLEQEIKKGIERQLLDALEEFERFSEGTSIQFLLRRLSEEVSEGCIALAEGVAAANHEKILPSFEILLDLQAVLLDEDLNRSKLSNS